MKSVLVIGGAHIDRKGKMNSPYFKGSSIPGTMDEQIGGSAFNIAANLARLGHAVDFVSPRIDASFGAQIADLFDNEIAFYDHPVMISLPQHINMPSYTALLDQTGELIAALADMQLYDRLTPGNFLTDEVITKLSQSDILVTDGNLPEIVMKALAAHKPDAIKWYGMATSPAKVVHYQDVLPELTLLSMNKNEAHALTQVSRTQAHAYNATLIALGLKSAIISHGKEDVYYYGKHEICAVAPPNMPHIVDVTGAGDALFSGFLSAIIDNASPNDALKAGISAAHITLNSETAQNPLLSKRSLLEKRNQLFP